MHHFKELPEFQDQPIRNSLQHVAEPVSRSSSSSPRSISPQQSLHEPRRPYPDTVTSTLAPPPSVPHGPRSPGQVSVHSRTPSPNTAPVEVVETNSSYQLDSATPAGHTNHDVVGTTISVPPLPSAKALGKKKAVEADLSDRAYSLFPKSTSWTKDHLAHPQLTRDSYYDAATPTKRNSHSFDDSDHEENFDPPWHRPIHYVYDAAAERAAKRLHDDYEQAPLVNGVH